MLTSVVRRVTRPAVEKRSMFENEKLWMLANMACRRFAAKPVEAIDAKRPARMPQTSAPMATATMISP